MEIDFSNSKNKIVLINSRNGSGKALPLSTRIPTPDGYKLMKDLKIGDKVFNRKGEPVSVIGIYPQGMKDIYEIEFFYNKKIRCCKDHLWSFYYQSGGVGNTVGSTEYILNRYGDSNGYIKNIRIDNNQCVEYKRKPVPVDPYTLGVFIGNGCFRESYLTLSSPNEEIPKKIARKYNFIAQRNSKYNFIYTFRDKDTYQPILADDFFKNLPKIINKYSHEKFIPDEYIYNSENDRWEILKGLFDSDGSISLDKESKIAISYSTTSIRLAENIIEIIRSLGYNANIYQDKRTEKYRSEECFTIRIIADLEKLMDKITSASYKHKKLFDFVSSNEYRNRAKNKTNYDLNYMKKITKLNYQEECQCIMVDDPEHLFLTENFVVTHNSVLMSTLTPFSGVTSLDERSSLSFIRENKNGYKEIEFIDGSDSYLIKHYYKASKDTHSIKSYFSLNGNELNENGNVTSFLALVEQYFGITPESMRLIRLGTNVNSFISLTPAKRKEYIGKLIEEIELYLKIHKKLSNDIRVVKVLLNLNNVNLYNCHISDVTVEKSRLHKLNKNIKSLERERDNILIKIEKIKALEKEYNVDELKRRNQDAVMKLHELEDLTHQVADYPKEDLALDNLMKKRNLLMDEKINIQSQLNSCRLAIDSHMKSIERIKVVVNRITSNYDIKSLISVIENLENEIANTDKMIKEFIRPKYSSEEIFRIISKLNSFNQIGNMIISLGNKPIHHYVRMKRNNESIHHFLEEQSKKKLNSISQTDLAKLLDEIFQSDTILSPVCDQDQFSICPYFRLSKLINKLKKEDLEILDDETLHYIGVISRNIDAILNELDTLQMLPLPSHLKECLTEKSLIDNLNDKKLLFSISEFQEHLAILKAHEIYLDNIRRLEEYHSKLHIYKNAGIDSQLSEIQRLETDIVSYRNNIKLHEQSLIDITSKISDIDNRIVIVSKYLDGLKYQDTMKGIVEDTSRILKPLEDSATEKLMLSNQLTLINNNISSTRQEVKVLENKITDFLKLSKENESLNKKHKELNLLLESVSTKKGIPVVYMRTYLGKIQSLANRLLSMIYDDELSLAKFQVTQEVFEVPYVKNGVHIPDVRYASQSELALITMALSFAISSRASSKYNILLLDEIDAGLDEKNRFAFMNMLNKQMQELNAEQVFMISHNLGNIADIPTDVIRLDDSIVPSKLQNVIYE